MYKVTDIRQKEFIIVIYKSDAYIPNKASGRFRYLKACTLPSLTDPTHRQWMLKSKLRLFAISMISSGIERIYDRNIPSLSNIITFWRTQTNMCDIGSVQTPLGLMTIPDGSWLNVKRCHPSLFFTTTPFLKSDTTISPLLFPVM